MHTNTTKSIQLFPADLTLPAESTKETHTLQYIKSMRSSHALLIKKFRTTFQARWKTREVKIATAYYKLGKADQHAKMKDELNCFKKKILDFVDKTEASLKDKITQVLSGAIKAEVLASNDSIKNITALLAGELKNGIDYTVLTATEKKVELSTRYGAITYDYDAALKESVAATRFLGDI